MSETATLVKFEPRTLVPTQLDAYTPTSFDQAMKIAEAFAKSGMLAGFQSKEQVLLVMAVGAELGIPATTALRGIHVISGKPVMSADLMVARVLASPACEFFRCIETSDNSATYETKRRGDPAMRQSFSMADAKRAGVVKGGSNWEKYPRMMLRHRAASELARLVYPDVVMGIYVEGEVVENGNGAATVEPLTAAPPPEPSTETPTDSGFATRISECSDLETLGAIRIEMKQALDPVPADLVTLWQARAKELRS